MTASRFVLALCLALPVALPAVRAAEYDLKEITPAVQSALDGRKARYAPLRTLKSQGAVGENKDGFVEVRQAAGDAASLVQAENRDRTVIYEAIAQQHQLGADGLSAVKRAFAEVQRDKAQPGDAIQLPSGEWTTK